MATQSTQQDHIYLPQEGGSKFQAEIQSFISCNHSSPYKRLEPGANFKFRFTEKGKTSQFNTVQHLLKQAGQKPGVNANEFSGKQSSDPQSTEHTCTKGDLKLQTPHKHLPPQPLYYLHLTTGEIKQPSKSSYKYNPIKDKR